jgi:hypothetical protein
MRHSAAEVEIAGESCGQLSGKERERPSRKAAVPSGFVARGN